MRKYGKASPPELRELRKAPFKRKLTHLLLKILEAEEMNVDMRYIDLSSFPAFFSHLLRIPCLIFRSGLRNIRVSGLVILVYLFAHLFV